MADETLREAGTRIIAEAAANAEPVEPPAPPPTDEAPEPPPTPDHTRSRKGGRNALGTLGMNKKTRSAVRAMTNADEDQLAQLYGYVALGLMPFHAKASVAFMDNAEACAKAWRELAAKNDNVRRMLLAVLEGGAWSGVILAHVPIVMSAIPESVTERFLPTPPEGENLLNGEVKQP